MPADPARTSRRQVAELDRRALDREPTNLRAYARPPAERACRVRVRDISSTGLFIEGLSRPLPRGTEVGVVFLIESGTTVRLLHRRARVTRVAEDGMGLVHSAAPERSPVPGRSLSPWSSLRWPGID